MGSFEAGSIRAGQQQAYTFQASSGQEIAYWLYLPQSYEQGQPLPLIVSLHGFLGFELGLQRVREQSPPAFASPEAEVPFIELAPQAPDGPWTLYHEPAEELVGFLSERISIDPDAQYLTGLSAGAAGVWDWALAFPYRFTGVAMIAGAPGQNPEGPVPEDICRLEDLPIWIVNSEAGAFTPIGPHRKAVTALKECGSTKVLFTPHTDLSHEELFAAAFTGPELYDWMLGLSE